MAFRFGLDPVLKHRRRIEELAQREFAEAQAQVDQCLTEIERMYLRIDEVREEVLVAVQEGTPNKLAEARDMEQFLIGQRVRIDRLRLQARELLQVAEAKHEALITAARERKVLTKLKEKKFTEHKAWLARLEAKELDDMTMVRTARRKL